MDWLQWRNLFMRLPLWKLNLYLYRHIMVFQYFFSDLICWKLFLCVPGDNTKYEIVKGFPRIYARYLACKLSVTRPRIRILRSRKFFPDRIRIPFFSATDTILTQYEQMGIIGKYILYKFLEQKVAILNTEYISHRIYVC